jgi:hypothetical protein
MKAVLMIALSVLFVSATAFAVPAGLYLAAPKKIEISGNSVNLFFDLACSNSAPEEWAGNLVAVSDDEGDLVVGLGVVLAKSSCKAGPQKEFVFEFALKETGLTPSDLKNGATFEPVNLAK